MTGTIWAVLGGACFGAALGFAAGVWAAFDTIDKVRKIVADHRTGGER